jgi:hypothetical protein
MMCASTMDISNGVMLWVSRGFSVCSLMVATFSGKRTEITGPRPGLVNHGEGSFFAGEMSVLSASEGGETIH